MELIQSVQSLNNKEDQQKPILLKIAPDLNNQQLDEIIELIAETKIDGVIASNTSTNREGLKATEAQLSQIGNGGLSGKPITERSTQTIKYLSDTSKKAFPIIGVGGIHSAEDALEKIEAGADLVQIYTGFIYEGPSLIKKINKALLKK
jgi:dihydroorotate dehydrogenase